MEGIQFVVNDNAEKVAVLIDLQKYKDIWEDFYDVLTVQLREKEPRESLNSVKELLQKQGKLHD